MRATSVFRRLLDVPKMFVERVSFEERAVVLAVRPSWRKPRCGECGRRGMGYDRARKRGWKHMNLGRHQIRLEYQPRRVRCAACGGIRTEAVPWAEHGSGFTRDFEELVAYLAQVTDKTQITNLTAIDWETVGRIVHRVVTRHLDPDRLEGLRRIGVDEFSYRRRHRYLTVVVDHETRQVVWSAKGRSARTLMDFFDELGEEGCAQIEYATIDMAAGYIKAIEERLPQAQIVFDRFHVQRLATDAVDEVRREQLRDLRGTPEGRALFHSRYSLLKNPWNLSKTERGRLSSIQRTNAPLYRAYLLKETLAKALDYRQPKRAERAMRDWLAWASRSRLKPFVRAARTIRKHLVGILAYIRDRLTNAVVEGINNRLRMIARRAYGFHSHHPLVSMIFLCCGGVELSPPLPGTHSNA